MSRCVLDASALLAWLHNEAGAERGLEAAGQAVMSAVNLAEVASKLIDKGLEAEQARVVLSSLGLEVTAFDESLAYRSAALRPATRGAGLSLGDRACLATAQQRKLKAVTMDRSWKKVAAGVEVEAPR